MATHSIVEINGSRYDAATGRIINSLKNAHRKNHTVIDGFINAPSQKVIKESPKHRVQRNTRRTVKSMDFHKRTQKSETLRRGGLKSPYKHFQTRLRSLNPGVSPERELRAKITPKHPGVNRFGSSKSPAKPDKLPARKAISGEIVQRGSTNSKGSIQAPMPSMITSVSHQKLERLLDEALTKADTHKQALRYHAARHFWQKHRFGGLHRLFLVFAILVILGAGILTAWQKVPQLSLKVAGLKAHVTPVTPSYKPDGYILASPAKAVSGAVTLKYKSQSDPSDTYELAQTRSRLTSSSVAQSIVPKGASVQTSEVEGNTVYIYGNSNDAAWVNNGVLYKINDDANLSSDQLIKIVEGLNP
ncbi:MAG TPA: DUF4367 domain-containing protein [Candidatus Saccharimonadales bacterium]|nr:DUF4367 domain-containing protein [Candidatus Saccharimonadales bacterium]